jgi:predicted nuclease of predicted toxin-antitoxin system
MKFLLDMGISQRATVFLRQIGHDAVHLRDEGLQTLKDAEIIQKALAENRLLLTHDLGFGEWMAASGDRLPSVVTFRLRNMRFESVRRRLERVLADHQETLRRGAMVTVTDATIRVRPLPIG